MTRASETSMSNEQRRATAFKLSSRETAEPSRNYARVPGYKKKYKKKTRKRREKKRKMNGVEINTRAYVATRLLLRWDYLYAVTLKTKVFGDYNHARLEISWITSTRGLLLRGLHRPAQIDRGKVPLPDVIRVKKMLHAFGASSGETAEVTPHPVTSTPALQQLKY